MKTLAALGFTLHTVCGRFALPVRKRHWWGFAAPNTDSLNVIVRGAFAHSFNGGRSGEAFGLAVSVRSANPVTFTTKRNGYAGNRLAQSGYSCRLKEKEN